MKPSHASATINVRALTRLGDGSGTAVSYALRASGAGPTTAPRVQDGKEGAILGGMLS